MNDEVLETIEEAHVTRRGLLVKGGIAAAGLTALGAPASQAFAAASAGSIKIAVVTHGDTGSFWSVFKKGVDHGEHDLKGRGVNVTQVREQRRREAVRGHQRSDRGRRKGDRDLRAGRECVEGP